MTQNESFSNISKDISETVIWSGKPSKSKIFSFIDWFLIPLGFILTFGGFMYEKSAIQIMLMSVESSSRAKFLFIIPVIIAIPKILVGIYILFFRFIVKYFIKRNISYEVTNQRLIISYKGCSRWTKIQEIEKINVISISGDDGSSSVYFYYVSEITKHLSVLYLEVPWLYRRSKDMIFFDITDFVGLEILIEQCTKTKVRINNTDIYFLKKQEENDSRI